MDQDFKPINYRRTFARIKYSRTHDQTNPRQYHMPPLFNKPAVKINNNKKYRKEEERVTQIERANRILFQKMRNIRLKKGPYSQPSILPRKKSNSFSRNNDYNTDYRIHQDFSYHPTTQQIRSKPVLKQFQTLPTRPNKRNSSVPPLRSSKNTTPKILYKQTRQIDGKVYNLTAYLQNGEFWLKADQQGGDLSNYMHMDILDYRKLQKTYLPNGVESLIDHIKIGKVIQLKQLDFLDPESNQNNQQQNTHRYQQQQQQ